MSIDPVKYVFNRIDFDELYDLKADPYEMTNLASDPAYEEMLRQMATRIWRRVHETDDFDLAQSHQGRLRHAPVGPAAG